MAKNYLEAYSEFIHQSQLERGLVSLYLRKKDHSLDSRLQQQFKAVDQTTRTLAAISDPYNIRLKLFLENIGTIPARRKYFLAELIEPSASFLFYSCQLIDPALEILSEMVAMDEENDPSEVNAYIHLLRWKERVGIERALGAQIIAMGEDADMELVASLEHV